MNTLRYLIAALISLVFLEKIHATETWESKEFNCAIVLPDGQSWSHIAPPAKVVKVVIKNKTEGTAILLYILDAPADGQTLDAFLPGFRQGWAPNGISTDRSEKRLQINGRPAQQLSDVAFSKGIKLYRVIIVVIDNGRVYQIGAYSPKANPLEDPEIRQAVESFHFLSKSSERTTATPQYATDNLPGLIGRITFYALVGIGVLYSVFKVKIQSRANRNVGETANRL
jgi:hypothetical protein